MNAFKIILILICVFISIVGLVLYNAFGTKRTFTILTLQEFGICFMVSGELKYELTNNGFRYSGGKNKGEFKLLKQQLSNDITKVKINGFNAGYSKAKNVRVYEYEVGAKSGELILQDTFLYASKSPMNLVPYSDECKDILKNYPNQLPLKMGGGNL
jgi:hypothetical protein